MVTDVTSDFHEDNKYYPQVFLNEYLYKLLGIDKTSASKECIICHYWYFLDKGFKF